MDKDEYTLVKVGIENIVVVLSSICSELDNVGKCIRALNNQVAHFDDTLYALDLRKDKR